MAELERIEKVIDYIEDHVRGKLALETIARQSGLSVYYIHRLFKKATGKSLMEYVRGRKLTYSLKELLEDRWKIIDIAMEYGFEHEQSYIRSFKNQFGISPARLRASRTEVAVQQKLHVNGWPTDDNGILLEPTLVLKPAFRVVGMPAVIHYEENRREYTANRAGVDFYYQHRQRIERRKSDIYVGLTRNMEEGSLLSRYLPSVEVEDDCAVPEGMEECQLGNYTYAVFSYFGAHPVEELSIKQLQSIYHAAYQIWLPSSPYREAAPFHFERIDMALSREDHCEADIYIPIEPQS